jgi:hypothetical protein
MLLGYEIQLVGAVVRDSCTALGWLIIACAIAFRRWTCVRPRKHQ